MTLIVQIGQSQSHFEGTRPVVKPSTAILGVDMTMFNFVLLEEKAEYLGQNSFFEFNGFTTGAGAAPLALASRSSRADPLAPAVPPAALSAPRSPLAPQHSAAADSSGRDH
ncbi:hypothetical protein MSG28_002906 [Choristoneura fumiferana]|uniref:Uncharacterized protein n=1 Tax=Choristoneura fumiferana TaxID=7141 RepID=A0ACC0JJR6_CHOFU|nr:hypothetical protein MSG28_002906 [Choristoneura fumiferana]